MEVTANGDPECAQEAVHCSMGKRWNERVREGAGESLLRERSVGVVEACSQMLADDLFHTEPILAIAAILGHAYRKIDPSRA